MWEDNGVDFFLWILMNWYFGQKQWFKLTLIMLIMIDYKHAAFHFSI